MISYYGDERDHKIAVKSIPNPDYVDAPKPPFKIETRRKGERFYITKEQAIELIPALKDYL